MLINQETGNFGDSLTSVHSAIKQYVDAKKSDAEKSTDKKKGVLKKVITSASK